MAGLKSKQIADNGFTTTAEITRILNGKILTEAHMTIGTPSLSSDPANKEYVDGVSAGLDPKESCTFATASGEDLTGGAFGGTYSVGGGSNSRDAFINMDTTQTIDGETPAVGDRVLVKNQGTTTQNGIYEVISINASTGEIERAPDHDGSPSAEVSAGNFTFVETGSAHASTGWVLTGDGELTLNTDAIVWTQFSAAASQSLATTLGVGNTSGGNDIVLSAGDRLTQAAGNDLALSAPSGQVIDLEVNEVTQWSVGANLEAVTNGNIGANGGGNNPASIFAGTSVVAADGGTSEVTLSDGDVSGSAALVVQAAGGTLSLDASNNTIETNATAINADAALQIQAAGTLTLDTNDAGTIDFQDNGTTVWQIDAAGNLLASENDNIGANGGADNPANIFASTSIVAADGGTSEVTMSDGQLGFSAAGEIDTVGAMTLDSGGIMSLLPAGNMDLTPDQTADDTAGLTVTFNSGKGGDANAGAGATGGLLLVEGGDGGDGTGALASGDGADVTIRPGAAGTDGGGGSGTDGDVNIGDDNTTNILIGSTTAANFGGDITLQVPNTASQDVQFTAHGATIPVNEDGANASLATTEQNLVGAINELNTAIGGGVNTANQQTFVNAAITGTDTALGTALANTPVSTASLLVYLNGQLVNEGAGLDYTVSGTTVTWLASSGTAPDLDGSSDRITYYFYSS